MTQCDILVDIQFGEEDNHVGKLFTKYTSLTNG